MLSVIRKATAKDIPRIKELWDSLMSYHERFGYGRGIFEYKKNADALHTKFIRKQLRRRNAAIFVAELDGKVAGYVNVEVGTIPPIYVHDKEAYLCGIVVDNEYRRKGIGKALMKEAEGWAKKKGLYSIALTVHTGNKGAYTTYKKSGFKELNLKMVKIIK